jgi:putative ABC transport system permease protein
MSIFFDHFKMAFRILKKQKLTSWINIFGLGIGLSFFLLLAAYVRDDLNFDLFHKNSGRTYILTSEFRDRFLGGSHHFIAEMLETEFPEVKPGSTVRYAMHSQIVGKENQRMEMDFAFTEPGFFDMFSFELLAGSPSVMLSQPNEVVLTASTAQSLFGGTDPIGQFLTILIGDTHVDFLVTGIVKDMPGNSSLRFDGLLPFSQVFDAYQIDENNKDLVTLPVFAATFLDLADSQTADSLRKKLPAFNKRVYGPMWESVKMKVPEQGFDLLRLSDYHSGDVQVNSLVSRSSPLFSWVLSGIALVILLLACVNSFNITVAQSSTRLKEIAMRKVIGAPKNQIVIQLLTESLLTAWGALIAGTLVASFLIVPFNTLTGKRLSQGALLHPQSLPVIFISVCFVCLFGGLIPASSLFRQNLSDVIKGRILGLRASKLSIALIVFQFTVSLFFVLGTLVITMQLRYMTSTDLGYDPSNVILLHTQVPGEQASEGNFLLDFFRNELESDSSILAVSADSGTVGDRYGSVTRIYDKDGLEHQVETFLVDHAYMKTLDVQLLLGQDFSPQRRIDVSEGALVNEAFVKEFELEDPVGMRFSDFADDKLPDQYTFDPRILGVVKDFHVFTLHDPIVPMAFDMRGFAPIQRFRNLLIKVRNGEESEVLNRLETLWYRIRPDLPFSYTFLNDALAWEYRRERNWSRMVGWSTGGALLIACMGLFGLTAMTVVRRTKEIGIRKVLGASAVNVYLLFSKSILKWVMIANFLAWPLALIAARSWLSQFAYRIDINLWIFAIAALVSFIVVSLTVSWHAAKAAISDPVQSLRYE